MKNTIQGKMGRKKRLRIVLKGFFFVILGRKSIFLREGYINWNNTPSGPYYKKKLTF
jgi:hypothetical protein